MSRIPVSPEAKPSREAGAMRGAAKARKSGVDAFGETSLQSEAALCQTKRNTLPREGRERRILLSISINLDKNYFDKINKIKIAFTLASDINFSVHPPRFYFMP